MKNNFKLFGMFCLMMTIFMTISPSYGKYTSLSYGEAGMLIFSTLKFTTETFIITDGIMDDGSGNVKDAVADVPKWGTDTGENKDYNLDSLKDVEFSIKNISSHDLLVTFLIRFKMNDADGWDSKFNVTIKNILSGDVLTGYVTFTKGDRISGGNWWEGLVKTYEYYGVIDPREFKDSNGNTNQEIIEDSFVVYADASDGYTSSSYQLSIDFSNNGLGGFIGGLIGDSEYLSVNMVAIPYN